MSQRRWPRRLLITLLVVAALLVAADRGGVLLAERIAGDTIQNSQQLSSRPDVSITGVPFLTQLASGHYDEVDITVRDLPLGQGQLDHPLVLDTLVVHLHDVTVPADFSSVSAASGTADAHASYAALATTLGTPISYAGAGNGGRVKASTSVTLLGKTLTGSISAAVRASSANGLRFVDPQVTAVGQRLPALDSALAAIFSIAIPLDGLPFNISVAGLDVNPGGLVLHLTGHNLSYS